MVFSTLQWIIPLSQGTTVPPMASTADCSAAEAAVESFSAQPTLPPSHIIPVRFATMFLMVPSICRLLAPYKNAIPLLAPMAAATAHPQSADSFPV